MIDAQEGETNRCDKFGHYVVDCHGRKRRKQHASLAYEEPPQKKLMESTNEEFIDYLLIVS